MIKKVVHIVFDRRHICQPKTPGLVEAAIKLGHTKSYKFIPLGYCLHCDLEEFTGSYKVRDAILNLERICTSIERDGYPLTKENFDFYYNSQTQKQDISLEIQGGYGFLDFVTQQIQERKVKESTKKHMRTSLAAFREFGHLTSFLDLRPERLREFNDWLLDGTRTEVTCHTYHKHLRIFCQLAYEKGFIKENPYSKAKFPRGVSKERQPLTEDEILKIRKLSLNGHLDKARDLFIFSCYTGLAYCDMSAFIFDSMTEQIEDMYYITGERIKSGCDFYTPILPPAMQILEKYKYHLPVISNQKMNDYMRIVGGMAQISKPVTCHVARHSFATLCLNLKVPVERLAKMLGHRDIRTTQIYAKLLNPSVRETSQILKKKIR